MSAIACGFSNSFFLPTDFHAITLEDARYYVRDFGVDIDEATRRLKLQEAIGLLNFQLATREADFFGGLYVEHQPVFQVVVLFTEDRDLALQSYLKNGPLEGMVATRQVKLSLRELEAIQIATSEAFASVETPFEHDIDLQENQVEIYITESNMSQVLQRANVETLLGPHVELVTVGSLESIRKLRSPARYEHKRTE